MLTAQYDGILSQFSHWYYPLLHCAAFMMPSLLFRFSKFLSKYCFCVCCNSILSSHHQHCEPRIVLQTDICLRQVRFSTVTTNSLFILTGRN